MRESLSGDEVFEIARESIDEDVLKEMLTEAYGDDVDDAVAQALQEVAAEEIALSTLDAFARARRRARPPAPEDIARSVEDRRQCCDSEPSGLKPLFGVIESE